MVETCCEPKASPSAFSICCGRDAERRRLRRGRSRRRPAAGAICRSLETSTMPGQRAQLLLDARRPVVELLRCWRPAARTGRGSWSARRCGSSARSAGRPSGRRPCASFGRSSRTTSSAGLRSPRGLSAMMMRPLVHRRIVAARADEGHDRLDVRDPARTMSATWRCSSTMPSKEMSCGRLGEAEQLARVLARQEALRRAREQHAGRHADGEEDAISARALVRQRRSRSVDA